ncbi:hypothetical protein AO715_02975 [Xanthomonas sp. Mitacek01]|nr:hypothetical protein AO715_02975 [Xanthomonas sp. Mitacek01]
MRHSRDIYRQVAELHVTCLDRSFLATLGTGFLSLMYEAIDASGDTLLLLQERQGQVVGFVSGGSGMGGIYKAMLRSPFRLGRALLPALINPRKLTRIFEILRYSQKGPPPAGKSLPSAELLSIAVSPAWRGQSIAEALYRDLSDALRARGIAEFRIVVGAALLPAHRFYLRMGAVPVGVIEVHDGESSTVYVQGT